MSKTTLSEGGHSAASDSDRLERLKSQHKALLDDARERGAKWFHHREEYVKLDKVLEKLPEDTSTEAVVPLTKKAFMLGHLVHTNEVMVLLGDNWFAERSAKQASQICQSRLKRCEQSMMEVAKEIELIEGWIEGTRQVTKGEGEVEIREDYDEEAELKWREEHAKRVRDERRKEKSTTSAADSEKDEEQLWRRLEELEMEEELEEHLQQQESPKGEEEEESEDEISSERSSDLSESPGLTDDEPSEPSDDDKDHKVRLKRKVSFASTEIPPSEGKNEPLCLIEVIHSDSKPMEEHSESPPSDASAMSPADLAHLARAGKARRRSILKPFSASDIRVREESVDTAGLDTEIPDNVWVKNLTDMIGDAVDREPEADNDKEVREPFINPIDDRIVERPVTTALSISEGEGGMSSAEPSRKVSRFKQSRVKK